LGHVSGGIARIFSISFERCRSLPAFAFGFGAASSAFGFGAASSAFAFGETS
jgi:hypothetical protein